MDLTEKTKKLQSYIQKNTDLSKILDSEIKNIYQELIDCISDHNHLYYINSAPIISDFEYDQLFSYLKKIEEYFPYIISGNSPTQRLVNQIQDGFKKGEHKAPMLSLENSYNSLDIVERVDRAKKICEKEGINTDFQYLIEPKFDGLSIELVYEDGIFIQGITRGDGYVGEDVTANIKTIKSIPKILNIKIPGICSFRGEVLIGKDELEKINLERESKGLQVYANTRNLASGSLKQLDPSITAQRNLICSVYELLYSDQNFDYSLSELGLPVYPRFKQYSSVQQVISLCENLETKEILAKENIDFDGLVIKIIGNDIRKILGTTAHHPRRGIAYKFPAQQVSTQIDSVDFQIGRTGIITPVANLKPVQLSGVTISRVSMHNFDFIKEKDIHYKDYVWIQRSGEVIPYITGVIKESRTDQNIIIAPCKCPSCGGDITNIDIHYYCENPNCPAQIKEKLNWFVCKDCMDIEGIGDSIIQILVDHNIISNISDLYKLLDFDTQRIVSKFPGFADKKLFEIQKQLKESKNKEFWRLLNGLGIPGIGKKTAKDICNEISKQLKDYSNLSDITKYLTNKEFLIGIYGIGEKIVDGIIAYRNENKIFLEKLEQLGLNFNCFKSEKDDNVKGHFCITGTFDFSRPEIIEILEKNGYIFDSTPTKNTNYMLVGSKPGSKVQKANDLGIKIISNRDEITKKFPSLLELIHKNNNSGPIQVGLF